MTFLANMTFLTVLALSIALLGLFLVLILGAVVNQQDEALKELYRLARTDDLGRVPAWRRAQAAGQGPAAPLGRVELRLLRTTLHYAKINDAIPPVANDAPAVASAVLLSEPSAA